MKAPITLEIIIHYYCNGGDKDFPDSISFREQSKMLEDAGLLVKQLKGEREYEANREAVKSYLDALLNVPFPKLKWVVPKNVLKKNE